MVSVPSARAYGFELRLNEGVMRDVLNGSAVKRVLREQADGVREGIETHVRATATAGAAENYVQSMFQEDAYSDEYGFDFNGAYELGNRPIEVIGVPPGRGVKSDAKPPLMTEAETHALTSPLGVTVGGRGEDIR